MLDSSPPGYSQPSETLPSYEPSIDLQGLALVKTEFITPYQSNNGVRAWKPVILQVNSTQLKMYSLNTDKKLQDLIVNLYFELNNLKELTIDLNTEYKRNNGVDFSFGRVATRNGGFNVDDLFSGDAYDGGFSTNSDVSKTLFNDSKINKFRNKLKSQKNQKIMNQLKNYYPQLKNNQFLFEPSSIPKEHTNLDKYKGMLIHSYSLSNLQIGEAPSLNQLISAMYKEDQAESSMANNSSLVKYKNTLRLRIEYKQILLQFWSFHSMVTWFRNLTIGRDLSVPLEYRTVSKLKSIPSRYSSRNNALLAATAAAAGYGRGHSLDNNHNNSNNNNNTTVMGDEFMSSGPSSFMLSTAAQQQLLSHKDDGTSASLSDASSVFDASERRSSMVSSSSATSMENSGALVVVINNFKFVSKDNLYTTVEKQYISNCIPNLNSFDKWNGKLVTISNVECFLRDERSYKNKNDVFISYSALGDLVTLFDRKFPHNETQGEGEAAVHPQHNKLCETRTFLIHQNGLVGVH
ncbi:uncharacterized protein LODBEIA_P14390 [Lodderomyces beijingensis]|uniref:Uncharacterized protein n=1 Tax=Lodderomyces beijingensis TaxID=1775926 RepID=A0ABP0ZLQ8_9ASCO